VYYESLSFLSIDSKPNHRKNEDDSAMCLNRKLPLPMFWVICLLSLTSSRLCAQAKIENAKLAVEADQKTGAYTIRSKENPHSWLTATMAAEVNRHWLRSGDYPQHKATGASLGGDGGSELTITYSGLSGQPSIVCNIRLGAQEEFAEIETLVRNGTAAQITVQAIRTIDAKNPVLGLDGPATADRVLSDSFSEDRPNMSLHDFADATDGIHKAVGSQLIYNRQSRQSFFVGALSSEKWLTVLRLRVGDKKSVIASYEVDSTGTTELAKENSLRASPAEDQIELSLPVEPGKSLPAEKLVAGFSSDYHTQLESYGNLIRQLHAARVSAPTPIGWWSWTAFYFGLTEGPALTNAEFLSAHLRDLGYTFFHIDEGYQWARGDYTSPVANKYPHGLRPLEEKVQALGLTPGIWTAPFEISERSTVYVNHKDWLVHNAKGEPIPAGWVTERPDTVKDLDQLYVIDSTNPAAQQYLREIYRTLVRDWGIRYIKLDFMDDSLIEGYYYRPNTTALEAQRIGLQIIREAVGEDVLLDKDGSPMLNPVGLVDTGRISCDTGHTFDASRDAAPGIAARYYMNRNYYVSDPDAFSVSHQAYAAQQDHGGERALTLDEAQVAIALAAVSGGMYEIGDDLPTLFLDADRMNLLKNTDLLNMARYGHAAKPLDLMNYTAEDEMPSVWLLRESQRQSILAVFNWTEKEREHSFALSELFSDRGLGTHNSVTDVFGGRLVGENQSSLSMKVSPHSVRMLKIVDTSIAASAPTVKVQVPEKIETGKNAGFSAEPGDNGVAALSYRWDFGDGTDTEGTSVHHAYTHTGRFTVRLTGDGIEGVPFAKSFEVQVAGTIDTIFRPELYEHLPDQR
jgi:alpha-galactosidase